MMYNILYTYIDNTILYTLYIAFIYLFIHLYIYILYIYCIYIFKLVKTINRYINSACLGLIIIFYIF